jgi:hypothetical protein
MMTQTENRLRQKNLPCSVMLIFQVKHLARQTKCNGLLPEPRKWAEQQNYDIIAYEDVYHDAIRSSAEDYIKGQCQFDYTKMTTTGVSNDSKKIKLPLSMHGEIQSRRRCQHYGSMRRSCYEPRRNKDVKAACNFVLTVWRKCFHPI